MDGTIYPVLSVSFTRIIILDFWEFFTPKLADGFSLKFKRQQISRTLLNILAEHSNAVVLDDH